MSIKGERLHRYIRRKWLMYYDSDDRVFHDGSGKKMFTSLNGRESISSRTIGRNVEILFELHTKQIYQLFFWRKIWKNNTARYTTAIFHIINSVSYIIYLKEKHAYRRVDAESSIIIDSINEHMYGRRRYGPNIVAFI